MIIKSLKQQCEMNKENIPQNIRAKKLITGNRSANITSYRSYSTLITSVNPMEKSLKCSFHY